MTYNSSTILLPVMVENTSRWIRRVCWAGSLNFSSVFFFFFRKFLCHQTPRWFGLEGRVVSMYHVQIWQRNSKLTLHIWMYSLDALRLTCFMMMQLMVPLDWYLMWCISHGLHLFEYPKLSVGVCPSTDMMYLNSFSKPFMGGGQRLGVFLKSTSANSEILI